jgi:hypothetical protein
MNRIVTLTTVLLLSILLALPALAEKSGEKTPQQLPGQAAPVADAAVDEAHQSEAFKRQQAYQLQREEMKARRDEAMKIRERNVNNNSPGKTGL